MLIILDYDDASEADKIFINMDRCGYALSIQYPQRRWHPYKHAITLNLEYFGTGSESVRFQNIPNLAPEGIKLDIILVVALFTINL